MTFSLLPRERRRGMLRYARTRRIRALSSHERIVGQHRSETLTGTFHGSRLRVNVNGERRRALYANRPGKSFPRAENSEKTAEASSPRGVIFLARKFPESGGASPRALAPLGRLLLSRFVRKRAGRDHFISIYGSFGQNGSPAIDFSRLSPFTDVL